MQELGSSEGEGEEVPETETKIDEVARIKSETRQRSPCWYLYNLAAFRERNEIEEFIKSGGLEDVDETKEDYLHPNCWNDPLWNPLKGALGNPAELALILEHASGRFSQQTIESVLKLASAWLKEDEDALLTSLENAASTARQGHWQAQVQREVQTLQTKIQKQEEGIRSLKESITLLKKWLSTLETRSFYFFF
jgi:hypothetical protein